MMMKPKLWVSCRSLKVSDHASTQAPNSSRSFLICQWIFVPEEEEFKKTTRKKQKWWQLLSYWRLTSYVQKFPKNSKKHEEYLDDDKNPIKHHKSRFKGERKKSSGCMNFDPERRQQYTCDRKSSSAAADLHHAFKGKDQCWAVCVFFFFKENR
jgi:hypothetical protein